MLKLKNSYNLNPQLQRMLENEPQIDYHIYKTFQILGLLGKGTYGQVYKVKNKKSSEIFALKKICDAYQNLTDAKRTYRQLNYLFQLSHPCIVKLYQVIPGYRKNGCQIRQSNTSRTDFVKGIYDDRQMGYNTQKTHDGLNQNPTKFSKHVYALFQYVETDLSKALRRCKLQPIQRKFIAYQILHGISYLHKSKLIHRDIKPSNILIDTSCNVKICDFGLSRIKQQKFQECQQNIITEYVASRWYRPPQILLGFSPCNQAIDMWGIGCIIAELVLRTPIFQGQSTMDQLQKIFRIIGLPSEHQINKLESDQARFLLRTFTFSRKNKPQKMNEVLSEASDYELDLIEKLLKFNPEDRLSAENALKHKYFSEMEQMNYNFGKFNIPVKIIDHTDPTFSFGEFKNFGNQTNDKLNLHDKNVVKKKEISLEQYQNMIEELQRATSRSSNRIYEQNFRQPDKVIENHENKESQRIFKQKSTRQSNFLMEHKKLEQKKEELQFGRQQDQIKQTDKILQNYNKQKSCSSSQKNLKIAQIIKDGRNVHSTMDNYFSNQSNLESKNNIFISSGNQKVIVNNKCNKSIEDNLEQTYGMFFNPFQKEIKKNIMKNPKKLIENTSNFLQQNQKKKVLRKISNNKSNSKLSSDTHKQKSFAKNNSKHITIQPQTLQDNKNKYSSHTALSNLNQSNFLTSVKGKIPSYKKPKDPTKELKPLLKDFSKGNLGLQQRNLKNSLNKTNLKSVQNLKSQTLVQVKKQRKKSKNQISTKKQESKQKMKRIPDNSLTDQSGSVQIQNYFTKINIKQRQNKTQIQVKHQKITTQVKQNQDLKKKTLEKKGLKSGKSKSIGKKKSQTKILTHK